MAISGNMANLRTVCLLGISAAVLMPAVFAEKARPQVRIEARVLEWQRQGGLDVDFAVAYQRKPGSGSNVESSDLTLLTAQPMQSAARIFFDELETSAGSFDAVIQALQSAGTVEILSKPYNVVTSEEIKEADFNNLAAKPKYTATLSNETEIPYESARAVGSRLVSVTEYQKAGVSLVVSVQKVIDNHLIILTMDTNVSEVSGFVNVGLNNDGAPLRVPTLDRRSIRNRLIVNDGEVFIAGLMKTSKQVEQRRGIPWISELPVLKYFLSSTRMVTVDTELVFLVKAEIVMPYKPYFPETVEAAE